LAALAILGGSRPDRPNVLWITAEDMSPNLGCYGDAFAVTPNLDRLAAQGVRYTHAFAPIGVCAPSRSTLIAGMYACSIGSQHMRSTGRLPAAARFYPEYLRDAGYYCTNNAKTDYNLPMRRGAWDESSGRAHWRGRAPGQSFFAIFNLTVCHESQIRIGDEEARRRLARYGVSPHDPAKVAVPPYHPDAPEVRRDWARYADMVGCMDAEAGRILKEIDDDGLAGDTIVFFYSDHGAGMPRSKRWLYDSSLRVPLLVRFPEKWKHLAPSAPGTTCDRLVSFTDLPPTLLSLAGLDPPAHFQGRAFLGPKAGPPREYVHGFRDRMDERYDLLRTVRDRRYRYIRNYRPDLPYAQHIGYMFEMPTMQAWKRLGDEGKLSGAPALFMAPTKPPEELYDSESDPHEVRNLAGDPAHAGVLARMRGELRRWMLEIRDLGFLPESDMNARFGEQPPYDAVRRNPASYPLERILEAAGGRADPTDPDPAVRFWAVLRMERPPASALQDASPEVRIAAAEKLRAVEPLAELLRHPDAHVRLRAVNALDALDEAARPALPAILEADKIKNEYFNRVVQKLRRDLGE
jgi:uncharacterized sulfatase